VGSIAEFEIFAIYKALSLYVYIHVIPSTLGICKWIVYPDLVGR
jgi:hypothetical protein